MNWYIKVLNQYADFKGRASREEFWMFNLFNFLISISIIFLGQILGISIEGLGYYGLLHSIYYLFILIPSFAVTVRRLHDVGKSGWMFFIILIPIIGVVWLIVLLVTDSELVNNKYGENLKNTTNDNSFSPEITNVENDIEVAISLISKKRKLLQETFESGLISQNELNEKLELLENENQQLESKFTEYEYKLRIEEEIKLDKEKLSELKTQGLLNEKEFEEKVDLLYKKQIEYNEKERLELEKQLEIEKGNELSATTEYLLFGGAILILLLFVAFKYFTSDF